ncbi:MAG: DUF4160 domain-containing protein [Pyrinomonadaceae bacterium]
MPTVLRQNGFDFKINTDDHEPMHVHIWKQGAIILINLGDKESPVSVRQNIRYEAKRGKKGFTNSGRTPKNFAGKMERDLWLK